MSSLFANHTALAPHNILAGTDAEAWLWPRYSTGQRSVESLIQLVANDRTSWQALSVKVFGKTYAAPRLTAFYADSGLQYAYSGVTHIGEGWPSWLQPWLQQANDVAAKQSLSAFNSVLLNYYRDGTDSMGWHSDDEPELGLDPVVLSISLGGTRRFRLRHKKRLFEPVSIDLADGDLLLMPTSCQRHWQHCITKTATAVAPRVNLTFRRIVRF